MTRTLLLAVLLSAVTSAAVAFLMHKYVLNKR